MAEFMVEYDTELVVGNDVDKHTSEHKFILGLAPQREHVGAAEHGGIHAVGHVHLAGHGEAKRRRHLSDDCRQRRPVGEIHGFVVPGHRRAECGRYRHLPQEPHTAQPENHEHRRKLDVRTREREDAQPYKQRFEQHEADTAGQKPADSPADAAFVVRR